MVSSVSRTRNTGQPRQDVTAMPPVQARPNSLEVAILHNLTPNAELDLDSLFGLSVSPAKVGPKERELLPRSLHTLDEASAPLLRELISVTQRGLGVSQYVYCELPILWIVNEGGKILFSLEEIVDNQTNEFALPRLRNYKIGSQYARLGHPSLVSAEPARIAGEIIFDIRADEPCWYITNGSGRYGIGHDRTDLHLNEVCRRFSQYGITLTPFFIVPVEKP